MVQPWHSWRRLLALYAVIATWCGVSSLLAAELRPYSPPSVQQSLPAPQASPGTRDKFFVEFGEKVKKLSPDEQKDLRAYLQKEYNSASQMKDVKRMGYYATLLQILSSP